MAIQRDEELITIVENGYLIPLRRQLVNYLKEVQVEEEAEKLLELKKKKKSSYVIELNCQTRTQREALFENVIFLELFEFLESINFLTAYFASYHDVKNICIYDRELNDEIDSDMLYIILLEDEYRIHFEGNIISVIPDENNPSFMLLSKVMQNITFTSPLLAPIKLIDDSLLKTCASICHPKCITSRDALARFYLKNDNLNDSKFLKHFKEIASYYFDPGFQRLISPDYTDAEIKNAIRDVFFNFINVIPELGKTPTSFTNTKLPLFFEPYEENKQLLYAVSMKALNINDYHSLKGNELEGSTLEHYRHDFLNLYRNNPFLVFKSKNAAARWIRANKVTLPENHSYCLAAIEYMHTASLRFSKIENVDRRLKWLNFEFAELSSDYFNLCKFINGILVEGELLRYGDYTTQWTVDFTEEQRPSDCRIF